MFKTREQDASSINENIANNSKENEKPGIPNEMVHRKRARQPLENIVQNVADSKIKLPIINESNNNLAAEKKSKRTPGKKKERTPNSSFNVEYELEQRILVFQSPSGQRTIKTRVISPIVDEEAPGPRQSLRNLPATKPPKLQRTNSTAKRKRILDGPNFENISSECKQYKKKVLQNIIERSWMYVIDTRIVKAFDPFMKNRNKAIMWLMDINKMFQERCCVVLNGIKIFDIILASVTVPRKLYLLVASTAYWISAKFDNLHFISIKRFLKSNESYTKEQYIRMELKILHLLNYNVNLDDPTLTVDYICMKMEKNKPKIKNTELLYHSSYFFLELISLECTYSSTDPTILAIAAVRSSMKLLPTYRNHINLLNNIITTIVPEAKGNNTDETRVHTQMIVLLTLACDRSHILHDLFQKYSSAQYCHISNELRNNIRGREINL